MVNWLQLILGLVFFIRPPENKNGAVKGKKRKLIGRRVSFGFFKGFGNNFLDGLDIG
jgi:hypothetical protein